ncbi:MAG: response regulator transcription factor [Gemmatimonadota bacterium]|nr:response regulator transcription factor [Gemmatimonadota bacterium]
MHLHIADDHRGVAEGIGALLAGQFEQISYALSPEEAEAASTESTFDLILLDLDFQHPDRNGFDLLVLARDLHPAAPSLILTQFGDPSLMSRAAALGAAGFVHKDDEATVLRDAVATVLVGGAGLSRSHSLEPAMHPGSARGGRIPPH